MFKKRSGIGFKRYSYRRQSLFKAMMMVLFLGGIVLLSFFLFKNQSKSGISRSEIIKLWEDGLYGDAYRTAGYELVEKPMDFFLLTIRGFSSYQLALAQINAHDTQVYIDNSIRSLRKALLSRNGARDPRIRYVLGKAYYYKGPFYADLAVKYLEEAADMSFQASDLSEYLGLAYASVHDYRNSVAALSLSLDPSGETGNSAISDLRLLTIAQSYLGLGEPETARAYLMQCVERSRDGDIILKARLLLGSVLKDLGETEAAMAQFTNVNEISGGNADAYYQLGEIYASEGDSTRARAEWRKAVKINPSHAASRSRLNL